MLFSKVKYFQTDSYTRISVVRYACTVVEEKFNVPWGHITGKRWGNDSGQPILALHGLFDNSRSFDKLIPLLKIKQPILALDIPGHGRSSYLPPGLSPNFFEMIIWLRHLIKNIFKFQKVSLLGHSFGSHLAFNYAGIFPDEVDKYISIDCARINMAARPIYIIDDMRKAYLGGNFKHLGGPGEGSYESFKKHMKESREKVGFPINDMSCDILLSGELVKLDDNVFKSGIDKRLHLKYVGRPTLPYLEEVSKKIKCDVLSIRASAGPLVNKRLEIYEQHITNMKKNCPKLLYTTVKGGHHVHLEKPEEVAKHINIFLN